MKRISLVLMLLVLSACSTMPPGEPKMNALTREEKHDGWRLLWNGHSLAGWHGTKPEAVANRWQMNDGVLRVLPGNGDIGTDLITDDVYSNFELSVEFKVTPGANSGVKTFVLSQPKGVVGLEYQIIDDALHPDAKLGRNGDRTLASLYDLYPAATSKKAKPVGEWNTARIISRGMHSEHWLNGEKVLEYDRGSPDFRRQVAQSKFKDIPNFGELPAGPILLQDHGNDVSFRNLKIRALTAQ